MTYRHQTRVKYPLLLNQLTSSLKRTEQHCHTLGYLQGENAIDSTFNIAHDQTAENVVKLTYFHIPVPFSCFESTSCHWDTSFVESLQVSVQLAEKTASVMSNSEATSDWTYESIDCHFDYFSGR